VLYKPRLATLTFNFKGAGMLCVVKVAPSRDDRLARGIVSMLTVSTVSTVSTRMFNSKILNKIFF
jgi:hypothetical protein